MYGDALVDLWCSRIQKGPDEYYSFKKLGAFSAGLAALSCFILKPWESVVSCLVPQAQTVIIGQTAFCLRALGRLSEASFLFFASMNRDVNSKNWKPAAVNAGNWCESELALGAVSRAKDQAELAVTFASRQSDRFEYALALTVWADALHQARKQVRARLFFRSAEKINASAQPNFSQLYGLAGFRYCDLILSKVEHSAWQVWLKTNCSIKTTNSELSVRSTRDVLCEGIQKFNLRPVLLRAAIRIAAERSIRSLRYLPK